MAHVAIPAEHFTKSAKTDYADHETAIFREAIQNSVDAGATEIYIDLGADWLSVADNGMGMAKDVLIGAMLTLSGSYKSAGSIGGFGAAKAILLFQHASYEIETNHISVKGSVLEYEMNEEAPYTKGTKITMHFRDDYNFRRDHMMAKAIQFLSDCYLPDTKIILDGSEYKGFKVEQQVKDLGWGMVYCDPCDDEKQDVVVRINGVKMFNKYVGTLNKKIVIEITKPSTEILTSNRDSFNWTTGSEIDALMQEITIDKASFGRMHNTLTKYSGSSRYFVTNVIRKIKDLIEQIDATLTSHEMRAKTVAAFNDMENKVLTGHMTQEDAIKLLKSEVKQIDPGMSISIDDIIAEGVDTDFFIQINKKGMDTIPKELAPSTMKLKYKNIALLWKAAINHVSKSNGIEVPCCIGFIVDDRIEAQYIKTDGIHKFMVNPYFVERYTGKILANKMLLLAAHEMTHMYRNYHDEYFMTQCESIILNALSYDFSPRKLTLSAKEGTI
jgi:hypothetical protein